MENWKLKKKMKSFRLEPIENVEADVQINLANYNPKFPVLQRADTDPFVVHLFDPITTMPRDRSTISWKKCLTSTVTFQRNP